MSIKANIMEIKRFAVHDGDGIRTTVFIKGCPLRCVWCHNPEGIASRPQLAYYESHCVGCGACVSACGQAAQSIALGEGHVFLRESCVGCGVCEEACVYGALKFYGRAMTVEELLPFLTADKAFYEASGGGVTLSGGECLTQSEFCAELLCELKANGIRTAVDTCGFVSRVAIERVLPYTDVFLYDIKAYDDTVHRRCTGQSNRVILENFAYLADFGKSIEVRIPFVPGYNDGEMEGIGSFLAGFSHMIKRVRVLPYHNYAGSKYRALGMENTLPERMPTDEEIAAACDVLKRCGVPVEALSDS